MLSSTLMNRVFNHIAGAISCHQASTLLEQKRKIDPKLNVVPSTARQKSADSSGHKWTAFVSPGERFSQSLVEVIDEEQDARAQIFNRCKTATLEQTLYQNTEPQLNLIQPGSMLWCVNEPNSMG